MTYIVGRKAHSLEATAALLPNTAAGSIVPCVADLSTTSGRDAVVACLDGVDDVSSLVHNAGVLTFGALIDVTVESYRTTMGVNVEAPIFLTQLLRPKLQRGARVLLVSSAAAEQFFPTIGLYGLSKNALKFAHSGLNGELNADGIYVGYVNPGAVDTPMLKSMGESDLCMFNDFVKGRLEEGDTHPPEELGTFLSWLLRPEGAGAPAGLSDEAFSTTSWDIDKRDQHPFKFTDTFESRSFEDGPEPKVEI